MDLDPKQRKAAEAEGAVLVTAGPGSGKTRVLVERICRLVESGTSANSILAITFTNKARDEVRKRLEGRIAGAPYISTFHGLAYDALLEHGTHVGAEDVRGDFESGVLDFDSLLSLFYALLREHANVLQNYTKRFHHVLVDEYQDTNEVQGELVRLLGSHGNVFAIGDPNQAIYGFRGATLQNFSSFGTHFPGATHISLSKNYRSCPSIEHASRRLLGKEAGAIGSEVSIASSASAVQEVLFVLRSIKEFIGGDDMQATDRGLSGDYHLGDIAILYRLKAVGREFEKAFSRDGIPYQIVGDGNFFERPEVREALESLQTYTTSQDVYASLKEKYDDDTLEGARKYENILQLQTLAASYNSVEDLLRDAALSREEDAPLRDDAVTLMTAHAAKGLEFPVVFVVGVEEGVFPYEKSEDIEEEKRLLYVAMTRAKERLSITHARRRTLFGKTRDAEPSRFLDAIPERLVPRRILDARRKKVFPQQRLL